MARIAMFLKIDAERVIDCLREARQKLNNAEGETVLDLSSVRRIDPKAVTAMEDLLGAAEAKAIKVGLRGVNVDIYKVLKLTRLAPRFCFFT